MRVKQEKQACAIIQALVDDWALVEDIDEDEHLILVNEDRMRMKGLRPSRVFVAWMEEKGYIKNFGVPLDAEPIYGQYTRGYPDGRREVHQSRVPHVFDFRPTPKGLTLLSAEHLDV
jgi:hypothetical protein